MTFDTDAGARVCLRTGGAYWCCAGDGTGVNAAAASAAA